MSLIPRPTGARGAPPNPNIELIQATLGLPRQRGLNPSGSRKPNEVLFSAFKNNQQLLPTNVRDKILEIVKEDKALAKQQNKNRAKISPTVAKIIADLIRNDN